MGVSEGCSLVVAHRLRSPAACGVVIPRTEIKPVSPALAGRFLTIEIVSHSVVSNSLQLHGL